MLEFCEETHTYTLDGVVIPSVTQIIQAISPYKQTGEVVEKAANFGTALHRTLELLDKEELGEYDTQLDPWIKGWKKFKEDLPEILLKKEMFVVDIKSGIQSAAWGLQLGGYALLTDGIILGINPMIEERFCHKYGFAGTIDRVYFGAGKGCRYACVQLRGDGEYKLHDCYDIGLQKATFQSFLNVYKWLSNNKKLNQEAKS